MEPKSYRVSYDSYLETWEMREDEWSDGDTEYNEVIIVTSTGEYYDSVLFYYDVFVKSPTVKDAFSQGVDLIEVTIKNNNRRV